MKRNIVIATVTTAALVGGGAATALAASGGDGAAAPRADVRAAGDTRAASAEVTAADAVSAALRHTPGTAVSADLDDDDDGSVAWEVDVLGKNDAWHSFRIDPANGKVLGSHTEREDDTAQVRAALKGSSVTAAEAAKAAAGKGTVTSVDLDEDGTSKGWDVETRISGKAEQDWKVDLRTGKVTADRADDHDNDSADDNDGDDD